MENQLRIFYEKYKEKKERQFEVENLIRINKIVNMVPEGKQRVLDLGCYNGLVLDKLKQKGHEVYGIELSEYGLSECKRKKIPVLKYDLNLFPYPLKSNTYDVIILGEVIEHVLSPDQILNEAKRMLKKKGILIITTPNLAALTRRIKLLVGVNPNIDVSLEDSSGHIRYYTFSSLTKLLSNYNFKIEKEDSDFILFNRFRFPNLVNMFKSLGWTIIVKVRK